MIASYFTAIHDTAIHDTAIHDTAIHDTAIHDTAGLETVIPADPGVSGARILPPRHCRGAWMVGTLFSTTMRSGVIKTS